MTPEALQSILNDCLKMCGFPRACNVRLRIAPIAALGCAAWSDNQIFRDAAVEIVFDQTRLASMSSRTCYDILLHELSHSALQYSAVENPTHTAYFAAICSLFYERYAYKHPADRFPLTDSISVYDVREESTLTRGQALDYAMQWGKKHRDDKLTALQIAELAYADYNAHLQGMRHAEDAATRRSALAGLAMAAMAAITATCVIDLVRPFF
ncbi:MULTISPECIES: hypothetical protein [Acidithiobacillus]|uniref:Uncharacterized protein n=2 Tax=Acidithiobacillus TaxID=119977 RepID=A0A179BB95_ACIFR|nr:MULTISPECIES: hypothetical protein [Acidithiobacillus]MEB8486768.1 hypothetical protein [Acidithiobacillus ferriphilus]MEB8488651.1 hypothetical protein [Acidithiobacillus ferriphilus]MEB8493270.1 hypothetical protein [Acidithiobacillus ferriphilus]MEB8513683.1 hypothetical protein [Acidithiobacillus ferriphilus]MEB8522696.1 hypothetical protein [Acidithiobacillus ferriphilus]